VSNPGNLPFSSHQKRALDARAAAVKRSGSWIHPDLSLFNPPSDNQPFIQSSEPFMAYPAPGDNPVVLLTYTVQRGLMAVITKLAIIHYGGNPPDGSGYVIWRVLQNGAGIRGLNNLTAQVGTFANPNDGFSIIGVENDIFTITVEVPAAAAPMPGGVTTAARIQGWTYPLSQATLRGQSMGARK
jgi:hypothetical protein